MKRFDAYIDIIGINPFVPLPEKVLAWVCLGAGKEKGPIRVRGTINDRPFRQTLVRYQGAWRLYINGTMLKDSPRRIGEKIRVAIEFDPEEKVVPMHPVLERALRENKKAAGAFSELTPSRRLEIVRYIAALKTEESVARNVGRAIRHLTGEEIFVGRTMAGKRK